MSAQDAGEPLLSPDEPAPFEVVNPDGAGRVVLVCDHASQRIPRRLGTLGVDPREISRHVAWDIGSGAVTRRLSKTLDAPAILCGYSRLVIDCNRPFWAKDAVPTLSEDTAIPGNRDLTPADRVARIGAIFRPYHEAIHRVVGTRLGTTRPPIIVSMHSFTPVYLGHRRPWDVGVCYRHDDRLARLAIEALRREGDLCVGDNEPYQLALDRNVTIPVHAEARGLPCVLFEIRQDHIGSETGIEQWASRLGSLLDEVFDHSSLNRREPPASDVQEWNRYPTAI